MSKSTGMYQIQEVKGRQIIDSRGNPTVEAEVILKSGIRARGASPSGASTGIFEAHELRDEEAEYGGKGVKKAAGHICRDIAPLLTGIDVRESYAIDRLMIEKDGTDNKSNFGANSILAVSIAVAKAAAKAQGMALYRYLGGISATVLPVPMMNILNGGAHAANTVDTQEFMIMPAGASCFSEGLRWCCEVYHTLQGILKTQKLTTAVGDEGGFAPDLAGDRETIELILRAVEEAGYQPGKDFLLALDAASSEWKTEHSGIYHLPKRQQKMTTEELIHHWKKLCEEYPIASIEDPLDEEDWQGWKEITMELGNKVQLVGDDLFVTNTSRLRKGIDKGCANSILIKLNQIGTISETIEAIKLAKKCGYTSVISHRSGETEDTTIADLAVALNAGQIKTGAPARSERVAKYNRLLRIEEELGFCGNYHYASFAK
ncbi:MAG: phosphopyruvate hydratase [Clostridiaceae bacterium]|nr:phosphopyruvate hydratase [Clostridiaceae bacterium]